MSSQRGSRQMKDEERTLAWRNHAVTTTMVAADMLQKDVSHAMSTSRNAPMLLPVTLTLIAGWFYEHLLPLWEFYPKFLVFLLGWDLETWNPIAIVKLNLKCIYKKTSLLSGVQLVFKTTKTGKKCNLLAKSMSSFVASSERSKHDTKDKSCHK